MEYLWFCLTFPWVIYLSIFFVLLRSNFNNASLHDRIKYAEAAPIAIAYLGTDRKEKRDREGQILSVILGACLARSHINCPSRRHTLRRLLK